MTDLIIGRAEPSDATSVVALLDAAAAWQHGRGIEMWEPGRFDAEVGETIANGDLYVARREGAIVGCFMLDDGSPRMTEWLVSHGREPSPGVVGRLAVARGSAGQGIGVMLLAEAGRIARSRNISYLRLEFPSDNDGLRRYYLGAGFTYCGENDMPGPKGEPWISSVFERPSDADT